MPKGWNGPWRRTSGATHRSTSGAMGPLAGRNIISHDGATRAAQTTHAVVDDVMAPPERPQVCRVVSPLAAPTRQAPRLLFASDAVTHAQEPAAAHRLRQPCEAAHATAQNVARSDRNRRDSQVALTHFSQIPTWRACTCRWPFFGDRGEGRVRLRVYERNFAEPIAPLLCSRPAPPSVPRRSAGPH